MINKNNIILITRTDRTTDLDKECSSFLPEINKYNFQKIYIISKDDSKDTIIQNVSVAVINDDNPSGPISINKVLQEIKKEKLNPDAFLVCSKEVKLNKTKIEKLVDSLGKNLVVGYKFIIGNDQKLNNELQNYYKNRDLIAYKIPWNTCALWNYKYFETNMFDEITFSNPFPPLNICINNVCYQTEHQGMEDALMVAKIKTENKNISYELIANIIWNPNIKSYENKLRHRLKLARKDIVLRNFMKIKNYYEDLFSTKKL